MRLERGDLVQLEKKNYTAGVFYDHVALLLAESAGFCVRNLHLYLFCESFVAC